MESVRVHVRMWRVWRCGGVRMWMALGCESEGVCKLQRKNKHAQSLQTHITSVPDGSHWLASSPCSWPAPDHASSVPVHRSSSAADL